MCAHHFCFYLQASLGLDQIKQKLLKVSAGNWVEWYKGWKAAVPVCKVYTSWLGLHYTAAIYLELNKAKKQRRLEVASFPGLPRFYLPFVFTIIHMEVEDSEKRGRPGSTLRPPNVIHVMNAPRPSPSKIFGDLPIRVFLWTQTGDQNGGGLGLRLGWKVVINDVHGIAISAMWWLDHMGCHRGP